METILAQAQGLVYLLLELMPSGYQRDSLQTMLGLFLEAQGHPLPEHSAVKSAGALSRFLNEYKWPTRRVIRTVRQQILKQLLGYCPRGRRPELQVIVDLTTLEKTGKFSAFSHLIHVLNGERGLHVVMLYLVVGDYRVPWGFRVWRGKDTTTPAQLAMRLINTLPKSLTQSFRVMVLADTAFGSVEFLKAMRKRRYSVIVGVRCDRKLADGRAVCDLAKKGQQVKLDGLPFVVTISWLYLERNGKLVKRFVLSTRPLKGSTIVWWGRRRWGIEGFFKTIKHRFGFHRFGQQRLLGVYRWLILSLISFVLAHWVYCSTGSSQLPDWGEVARLALELLFPQVLVSAFFVELLRLRPILNTCGFDFRLVEIKQ